MIKQAGRHDTQILPSLEAILFTVARKHPVITFGTVCTKAWSFLTGFKTLMPFEMRFSGTASQRTIELVGLGLRVTGLAVIPPTL